MKKYQARSQPQEIQIGDKVLIKNDQRNKNDPIYNPIPLKITNRKGNMISAQNTDDKVITRSKNYFKKVPSTISIPS